MDISYILWISTIGAHTILLTTFVESWWFEMSTFHLPIREMTITLKDEQKKLQLLAMVPWFLQRAADNIVHATTIRVGKYTHLSRVVVFSWGTRHSSPNGDICFCMVINRLLLLDHVRRYFSLGLVVMVRGIWYNNHIGLHWGMCLYTLV